MSAGPNGPCPYLGEPSVTHTLIALPIRITSKRNCLTPINFSWGPHWSSKPTTRGRQRISLFKDFTCIQKLLRVLALETSDTQVKGRGNPLIPSSKNIVLHISPPTC